MTKLDDAPTTETTGAAPRRRLGTQFAVAAVCAALGFALVAQVRAGEGVGRRLEAEREEDLARILSDLSTESERLQQEIAELRLTLLAFENNAQDEALAVRSLQRRLDDLRILAGVVPAEGRGVVLLVQDPEGVVGQEQLVDTVQELRDAGAEAIAVNGIRLVASSAFTTRNDRLLVDGQPLDSPYRLAAVGPSDTLAKALAFPGGAVDGLELLEGVTATVETLGQLTIPARSEPVPFVFGEPVPPSPPAG